MQKVVACMIKIAICDDDIELTSQLEIIIKNFARSQNIQRIYFLMGKVLWNI